MDLKKEFLLELSNIRPATEFVRDVIKQYKCTNRENIWAQLFTEETMVYWAKMAAAGNPLKIAFHKRFKTISLSMSFVGAPANPLAISEGQDLPEEDLIGSNILIGLSHATYTYKNGCNKITYTIKQTAVNPALAIGGALIGGILCGLLLNRFLPALGPIVSGSFLTPVSQAFFGLLNGMVAPLLFVSVIASIFNMENLAQMKRIFGTLLAWFMGITVAAAIIAVAATLFYFPITASLGTASGGSTWGKIVEMLFGIIPVNVISPFLEGNTLQIIFLAIISGMVMLTLKGRFPVITDFVTEINLLLSTLLDAIVSLMPWVVFISIFNMALSGEAASLLGTFAPILLILLCYLILLVLVLLSVAIMEKMNPLTYLKTIGPVLMIAMATASSSATFSNHEMTGIIKQNIRDYVVKFAIPVGALFSKPFAVPPMIIISLFVGGFYQVPFAMTDLYPLALLCIILSIAVPPTPGMGSFLFTVIFTWFGIPMEGLAMALTIDIFLDYIITPGNVLTINASMLHIETGLKKLDRITNKAGR